MITTLIANSSPKCFHTETVKTSLHKDTPPDSYIKQSLSLSVINKTLLETAAYLTRPEVSKLTPDRRRNSTANSNLSEF